MFVGGRPEGYPECNFVEEEKTMFAFYPEYGSIASGSIIPGLLTCSKSLKSVVLRCTITERATREQK